MDLVYTRDSGGGNICIWIAQNLQLFWCCRIRIRSIRKVTILASICFMYDQSDIRKKSQFQYQTTQSSDQREYHDKFSHVIRHCVCVCVSLLCLITRATTKNRSNINTHRVKNYEAGAPNRYINNYIYIQLRPGKLLTGLTLNPSRRMREHLFYACLFITHHHHHSSSTSCVLISFSFVFGYINDVRCRFSVSRWTKHQQHSQ